MYRIFVAIDLPEDIKSDLFRLGYGIPGVRWVDDDQLHLTLRFIGEVDGALFDEIAEEISFLKHEPFIIRLQGLGHFPPRGEPKVLWVGVNSSEGLTLLRSKVDSALRRLDVLLEKRKFSPHITIARLKKTSRSRLTNFIAANNLYKSRKVEITSFHLYSSVLTSKGAIHTLEQSYPLL